MEKKLYLCLKLGPMYQKNQAIKLKNSDSIFVVLDCEKILDVKIYYLNSGISVAEHQIDRPATDKEKTQYFVENVKKHFHQHSRKINLMFAENLNKGFTEVKLQSEQKSSFFDKVKKKIFG
jgi:hypothetical protein